MKLITNKDYDTILTYFPGVDYYGQWTLENPTIYSTVSYQQNGNDVISIPSFTTLTQDADQFAKYLLLKLSAGVDYILSSDCYPLSIDFYDFYDINIEDVQKGINALQSGVIDSYYSNYSQTIYLKFDQPKLLLARIYPYNWMSLNRNIIMIFSNPAIDFDYTSHWIRDWYDKIDGSKWNYYGKVNKLNNSNLINRRIIPKIIQQIDSPQYKIDLGMIPIIKNVQPLVNGVQIYLKQNKFNLGSLQELQKYFDDIEKKDAKIIKDASFEGNILGYSKDVIVMIKFLYYMRTADNYEFRLEFQGQCGIIINESQYYNYDDYCYGYFSAYLKSGYNKVVIYYNTYKYGDRNNPKLIFYKKDKEYDQEYHKISYSNFFVENVVDTDIYVSYQQIFSKAVAQAFYDNYLIFDNDAKSVIFCPDIVYEMSICFWLYFQHIDSSVQKTLFPYNIISNEHLIIQRIQDNKILIKFDIDGSYIQIPYEFNLKQWFHVCLVCSSRIISYYFNVYDNGYYKVNNDDSYGINYNVGLVDNNKSGGKFQIYNLIIFNKPLTQIQVNRIYLNKPL